MAEDWANTSWGSYPEKEMEVAWSQLVKSSLKYYQASLDLEPLRKTVETPVDVPLRRREWNELEKVAENR